MKYHIVKVSSSGLGDAIKSALVGAIYAKLSERSLVIDWRGSRYSKNNENVFYSLFSLSGLTYCETVPVSSNDVNPTAWKDRIDSSLDQIYAQDGWKSWDRNSVIRAYSTNLAHLDYSESVTVNWDFDQAAKLLCHFPELESVNDLFRYAAQHFLNFNSSIIERVNKILEALPRQYMAVHIRETHEFTENKGHIARSRYLDLIKDEAKVIGSPIYLASDNIDVQSTLTHLYPNIVVQEKWFAAAGEALHLSDACPDQTENAKQALIDIAMLANSNILICNNQSCFALVAQYFSPHDNQRVRDVSQIQDHFIKRLWVKVSDAF